MKSEDAQLGALFDVARHGDEPSEADRRRVSARVAERLALGAGMGAAAFTLTRFGWGATFKTWSAIAVAVAGAGSGAYLLVKPNELSRAPSAPVVLQVGTSTAPRLAERTLVPPPALLPERPAIPESRPVQRERSASALAPASSSAPLEPRRLARETSALRAANEALRAGSAARALTLLEAFAKDFPNGVLTEEALATRVSALCALGRVAEARALGSRFVQRYPRSPVAARVRGSCAMPKH